MCMIMSGKYCVHGFKCSRTNILKQIQTNLISIICMYVKDKEISISISRKRRAQAPRQHSRWDYRIASSFQRHRLPQERADASVGEEWADASISRAARISRRYARCRTLEDAAAWASRAAAGRASERGVRKLEARLPVLLLLRQQMPHLMERKRWSRRRRRTRLQRGPRVAWGLAGRYFPPENVGSSAGQCRRPPRREHVPRRAVRAARRSRERASTRVRRHSRDWRLPRGAQCSLRAWIACRSRESGTCAQCCPYCARRVRRRDTRECAGARAAGRWRVSTCPLRRRCVTPRVTSSREPHPIQLAEILNQVEWNILWDPNLLLKKISNTWCNIPFERSSRTFTCAPRTGIPFARAEVTISSSRSFRSSRDNTSSFTINWYGRRLPALNAAPIACTPNKRSSPWREIELRSRSENFCRKDFELSKY